jgi:hypothetical protein
VPAVDLFLPFAPLSDLVSGWSDGYTRRECRLPPRGLGVWVASRVSLAGSALCPLADLGGPWVGQVVSGSGEATEGVRYHIEVGWVHGESAGLHTDALGQ